MTAAKSKGKTWIVATSIGVVEAMKDQGICRWNHALRFTQQPTKNNFSSFSQTKKLSSSSSALLSTKFRDNNKSEESLRTVMYLSCWGPNT